MDMTAGKIMTLHAEPGIWYEHQVLSRHWAKVQQRVTGVLQLHVLEIQQLQGEVQRLRGQLLVARTAMLWGLSSQSVAGRRSVPRKMPVAQVPAWREAKQVICQTGCVGHAHPWLSEDGQCLRTLQPCDAQSK